MDAESTYQAIDVFSSLVLAIFTVVLAIATWRYYEQSKLQASETASQTEEMGKTRKLRYEPKMKAGITLMGPNFHLGFVNIGGGIAHDVKATYWVEGVKEYKQKWGTQVHYPEDNYKMGIPVDESPVGVTGGYSEIQSKLDGGDDTFVVEWNYKNAAGEEFSETQRFSISDKIKERTEGTEFYTNKERETRF
ncbi:hypothetical protein [Natronobeatus ordinarius]|uniref:hypothetical protein n=1 Tax=Natronobeatus ordinarius TaxID=2963433 RepID=UPI0020CDC11A|nr:hypothetical protein [Natronobeatus ordinarius]